MIRIACLDMAGTTVADDGAVEAAFVSAMSASGVAEGTPTMTRALAYVRTTMGQSKIAVFTHLFDGDRLRASAANDAFEVAYGRRVASGDVAPVQGAVEAITQLRDAGVRVCLTTGFSPVTRDAIVDALGWSELVDLVLSPADAGRGRPFPDMNLAALVRLGGEDVRELAVAGDTTSDLLAGWRAGASIVAGVLTGAHDAETLSASPHTHLIASVADLPTIIGTGDGAVAGDR
jgi:phosphonatase-like hydrolase